MDISEEKSCEKVNLLDSDIEQDEDDEDRFINKKIFFFEYLFIVFFKKI